MLNITPSFLDVVFPYVEAYAVMYIAATTLINSRFSDGGMPNEKEKAQEGA